MVGHPPYDDSTLTYPLNIYCWENARGQQVSWGGEIFGYETDMPGTNDDRCYFDNCQYKPDGGNWLDADFQTAFKSNSDTTEFGNERTGDASFLIYDKRPLPTDSK